MLCQVYQIEIEQSEPKNRYYDEYKNIVTKNHENVKGNLLKYMKDVIRFEIPNKDTIDAIKEVEAMKKDNSIGKAYTDVDRMMEELLA